MRLTGLALLLGLVVFAAGGVRMLAPTADRAAYSNQVVNQGPAALLPPGRELCQADEDLPQDARAVTLYTGSERPAGPLRLTVLDRGRSVLRATSAGLFRTGPLTFGLPGRNAALASVRVCVRNLGRRMISIGGATSTTPGAPTAGAPAKVAGRPQGGRVRLDYGGPGRRSGWSMATEVIARAALVKGSLVGKGTIWGALALTLAAIALSVGTLLRDTRP